MYQALYSYRTNPLLSEYNRQPHKISSSLHSLRSKTNKSLPLLQSHDPILASRATQVNAEDFNLPLADAGGCGGGADDGFVFVAGVEGGGVEGFNGGGGGGGQVAY